MNYAPQAIIFDFDYTLADSSPAVVDCINYALNKLQLPAVTTEQACRTIGLSLPNTFLTLAGPAHLARSNEFVQHFLKRADEVMVERTVVFETTPLTSKKLKQAGFQAGIVSTKYRHRIEAVLHREKLLAYFDIVIGGEDVAHHKPHPEGLNMALKKLGCSPARALYVGDSPTDAETAQRAGVAFVAVLSGTTPKEEFNGYPVSGFLPHVGQLPAWLAIERCQG